MFGKLSIVDCQDDVLCYPARFLPFLPAHLASTRRISRSSFMISSAICIVASKSGSEGVMRYTSGASTRKISSPRSTYNRSEEHKYELQSLMRNTYAVFCLKK